MSLVASLMNQEYLIQQKSKSSVYITQPSDQSEFSYRVHARGLFPYAIKSDIYSHMPNPILD
jgi:hypothetical protein